MRCLYTCKKKDTGAVDRCAVLCALREEAMATPDREERVKFVPGTKRGKKVRREGSLRNFRRINKGLGCKKN